jgi:membrane protein
VTIRSRAVDVQAAAKRYAERAEASRQSHGSIDAVYAMVDRDGKVGGGIMAGSLAYRLFIWLLPFSLVVVAGIGLGTDLTSETAASATRSLGLRGLVAKSVAESSQSSSRWYALVIGIPVLIWATRNLLRALVIVHRLVWGDPRGLAQKVTMRATARFFVLALAYFVILELASHVGSWTGSYILKVIVAFAGIFGWWLVVSLRLPHHAAPWYALVPGAILVAIGLELISGLGSYFIATRVNSSQSAYGVLGVAAGLLFGLFLISRLVVASAVINATVWERRHPAPEV